MYRGRANPRIAQRLVVALAISAIVSAWTMGGPGGTGPTGAPTGPPGAAGAPPSVEAPPLGGVSSSAATSVGVRASVASALGDATYILPADDPGPSSFASVAMAYDPALGAVVAVDANLSQSANGSVTWSNPALTWTTSGGLWTQVNLTTGPPPLLWATMVYDAVDGYLLYFGGMAPAQGFTTVSYTWSFANGTWANLTSRISPQPPPLQEAQTTFDPADGYVVLHGGFNDQFGIWGGYAVTWTYSHGDWTNVTNASRPMPALDGWMAYDAAAGFVLYFGGAMDPAFSPPPGTFSNATWEFLNGTWTNLSAQVHGAPPPRAWASMVYDPADKVVLLMGGSESESLTNQTYVNDTWSFSGSSWSLLRGSPAPSPRSSMLIAYDAATSEVIGFGGFGRVPNVAPNGSIEYIQASLSDTWSFASGEWSPVAPLVRMARPVVDAGMAIELNVSGGPQGVSSRFAYIDLPVGCPTQNDAGLTCTPTSPGTYRPSVEVATGEGDIAWASTLVQVNPRPVVVSFGAASSVVRLGGSLRLDASTANGTGSVTLAYSGLPPGCVDQDTASLVCTPTSTGSYTILLSATDVVGGVASGSVSVAVVAAAPAPLPVAPPAHGPRTGGAPPIDSALVSSLPGAFFSGLLVGLVSVLVVGGWTVWRTRFARRSERLVAELEAAPLETTAHAAVPPDPRRSQGARGGSQLSRWRP
jgi:hypothetical protein